MTIVASSEDASEMVPSSCHQAEALGVHFDRIYFSCGSGGTAAGLALAHHLAGGATRGTELVGLGVDDDPETFYDKIDAIVGEIKAGFRSREVRPRCGRDK